MTKKYRILSHNPIGKKHDQNLQAPYSAKDWELLSNIIRKRKRRLL